MKQLKGFFRCWSLSGFLFLAFAMCHKVAFSSNIAGRYWVDNMEFIILMDKARLCGYSGEIIGGFVIPNSVTIEGVTFPVVSFGSIFSGCSSLTSIEIPSSVTSIGSSAFEGCSNLTTVVIGNSVTSIGSSAFQGCSSLTSVNIPSSVTTIEEETFYECSSLKSINIPSSVTTIEKKAFYGCSSLTSVVIPNSVTSIGWSAFEGCSSLTSVNIPSSVATIEEKAFYGCSSLTSVVIPNSVTSIGRYAFKGCISLTSVNIPSSVTTIEEETFYECSSLKSINIPSSVATIEEKAFYGCSSLTSVVIPNSVTSIGWSAFEGCSSLESVDIPNSVTSIADYAFARCISLKSVVIDANLSGVGFYIFDECYNLTSAAFGNSVTTIEPVLRGCTSLESVEIPNSVTSIGWSAFNGCSSLESAVFPETLREMEYLAFNGCDSLKFITVLNPIPPKIEHNTFVTWEESRHITVSVPRGSEALYRNHPYWGAVGEIVGIGGGAEFTESNMKYQVTSEKSSTVAVSSAMIVSRSGGEMIEVPEKVANDEKEYRVTGVANSGFRNSSLSSIVLPSTISYVGVNAFADCGNLAEIRCDATMPPSADESSFDEQAYSNVDLKVPEDAIQEYRNHAVWGKFSSIKEPSRIELIDGDMTVEINYSLPYEVYDLSGQYMGENVKLVQSGIYIIRQLDKVLKIRK